MSQVVLAVLALFPTLGQESTPAQELLEQALAQARESKRMVFLTFGSPG